MKARKYEAPSPMDENVTKEVPHARPFAKTVKEINAEYKAKRAKAKQEYRETRQENPGRLRSLGAAALRAFEGAKERWASWRNRERSAEPLSARVRALAETAIHRAGQLAPPAPAMSQVAATEPASTRTKLDDEQPSHPDAAPLGETIDATVVSEDQPATPEAPVKTPEERSDRVATLAATIELFDTDYLGQAEDDTTEPSPLQELTRTRAALAEASFDARKGRFVGNKKYQQALADTQEAYQLTRDRYLEELLENHDDLTPREQSQLAHTFFERETGALAGEEAQHYLTMNTDPGHMSRFNQVVERYNSYSTKKKIMIGIGASAVVGATLFTTGLAATAAGAAAGVTYGARAGMNMFRAHANSKGRLSGEAKAAEAADLALDSDAFTAKYGALEGKDTAKNRRKVLRARRTDARRLSHEMNAVAYAGADNQSLDEYLNATSENDQAIAEVAQKYAGAQTDDDKQTIAERITALDQDRNDTMLAAVRANDARRLDALDQDRKRDRRSKVKVLATAAVGTLAGAGVGYLGHTLVSGGGIDSIKEHLPWNHSEGTPASAPAPSDGEGYKGGGYVGGGDTPPEAPKVELPPHLEATPDSSAEDKYLYGNFAGNRLEVQIAKDGTVWGSVRHAVLDQNPGMSFQEADRITGNLVAHLTQAVETDNPGFTIDYTRIQPGDIAAIDLTAAAAGK